MSASRTALRVITILFLLAGILLLRRPVFGAVVTAPQTRFSVVIQGATSDKSLDVILIPGISSSRDIYTAEAKLLSANYRLHLVQIAGFAGEPAGPNASGPILVPIIEQLHQYIVTNKLQHPAIIGHSLGGLLGLMLADSHPEDVGKLLIIDSLPFYALVFAPEATVDATTPQAAALRDQMLAASPEVFAAMVNQSAAFLVLNPEARKLVPANSIASDRTVITNAMYEDLTTDLRPRLAGIKTPATLLYPFDASVMGPDTTKIDTIYINAYNTMPNLKIHRIDDSRHFIMYDQPGAFDKAVQAFLKP
ncbi:MAG TPA: alpha/beta hydrolase [Edaphobacter sp.]|nr:alpha/beta hydrolase [Edaphobacter sp.]